MKILFNVRLYLLLVGMAGFLEGNSQEIIRNIEQYAARFSPERAYIHFDKPAYAPGETIWFKAYLLNELTPAVSSKTYYVDWIDEAGRLVNHSVSPLVDGVTNGQFEIPANFKGKYISVRAYTRWMLNFDSAFLFSKTIPVLNKDSLRLTKKPVIRTTLTFFPEGGDAIAGINNKIAFKATDQWERPVAVRGVIIESNGKVVDSFKTVHDGMGYINLVPKRGAVYQAKWKDANKADQLTELPRIKDDGVSLQVTVSPGRRNFNVELSPGLAGKIDSLYIIGTMYQHLVFSIGKAMTSPRWGSGVPIRELPYGILTITVFDKSWKPLAERITYINNLAPYLVKADMEVERWGLSYRARDEIRIRVPDSVASNLSVAVTDMAIGADSSSNILSGLMLSSEIKGKIHNPAYYFSDTSDKVQQRLDLVMLTNGWRRFKWDQILAGKFSNPVYHRDSAYLALSGKVLGVRPGVIGPGSGVVILMKQKDTEGKVLLESLKQDGTFIDPGVVIFDTARVFYQLQDKKLKESQIDFMTDRLRVPEINKKGWANRIFPDTTGSAYHLGRAEEVLGNLERSKYKELETVTVAARAKSSVQKMDEKYASGMFSGDGIQFDLVNDPSAQSAIDIFSFLQGRVAGLQISGYGSGASLNWRGGAPQLYIDEMPADVSFVSALNVRDVAYIKVFRPPFMGGFNGSNGAIAIYTRRGGDQVQEPGKGLASANIAGYSAIRQFYSPKYYSPEVKPGSDRDLRTTLYWNPNVAIDPAKKEIILSFNNNDVTDAFRVVIEGMTQDGRLIHYTTTME